MSCNLFIYSLLFNIYWFCFFLLVLSLCRYAYWPYGAFKRLGISGPKPIPFFGTMLHYRRQNVIKDKKYNRQYKKSIYRTKRE
uniref:Uncharacterized protein n=1 Tax=Cyprinodon variegatus TaxID=28743 RepID=A0A3Q2DEU3_CYPVA